MLRSIFRSHGALHLLASFALLALAECVREPAHGPAVPSPSADSAARLELPELIAPSVLPARRVLQIFYTANVAAELDPCG